MLSVPPAVGHIDTTNRRHSVNEHTAFQVPCAVKAQALHAKESVVCRTLGLCPLPICVPPVSPPVELGCENGGVLQGELRAYSALLGGGALSLHALLCGSTTTPLPRMRLVQARFTSLERYVAFTVLFHQAALWTLRGLWFLPKWDVSRCPRTPTP